MAQRGDLLESQAWAHYSYAHGAGEGRGWALTRTAEVGWNPDAEAEEFLRQTCGSILVALAPIHPDKAQVWFATGTKRGRALVAALSGDVSQDPGESRPNTSRQDLVLLPKSTMPASLALALARDIGIVGDWRGELTASGAGVAGMAAFLATEAAVALTAELLHAWRPGDTGVVEIRHVTLQPHEAIFVALLVSALCDRDVTPAIVASNGGAPPTALPEGLGGLTWLRCEDAGASDGRVPVGPNVRPLFAALIGYAKANDVEALRLLLSTFGRPQLSATAQDARLPIPQPRPAASGLARHLSPETRRGPPGGRTSGQVGVATAAQHAAMSSTSAKVIGQKMPLPEGLATAPGGDIAAESSGRRAERAVRSAAGDRRIALVALFAALATAGWVAWRGGQLEERIAALERQVAQKLAADPVVVESNSGKEWDAGGTVSGSGRTAEQSGPVEQRAAPFPSPPDQHLFQVQAGLAGAAGSHIPAIDPSVQEPAHANPPPGGTGQPPSAEQPGADAGPTAHVDTGGGEGDGQAEPGETCASQAQGLQKKWQGYQNPDGVPASLLKCLAALNTDVQSLPKACSSIKAKLDTSGKNGTSESDQLKEFKNEVKSYRKRCPG